MTYNQSTGSRRRPGAALFTVLAVLAIAMIVIASMLGGLVREHRQCRLRHEQRQCRRLAEASVARAERLLANNADYTGGSWTIAADDSAYDHDAEVSIVVTNDGITATASYPAGESPRVRHSETALVNQ